MTDRNQSHLVLMQHANLDETLDKSLGNKLQPPLDFDSFYAFCRERVVTESIDFYVEIDQLKDLPDSEKFQRVKELVGTYIRQGSPKEINIPGQLRTELEDAVTNADEAGFDFSVFVRAQEDVKDLIESGPWLEYIEQKTLHARLAISRAMAFDWIRDPKKIIDGTIFTFPSPVNQIESRMHNISSATLVTILLVLKYTVGLDPRIIGTMVSFGFLTRTLMGPRFDLQAWTILFVLRPFLEEVVKFPYVKSKFVSGPPYRFAQFLGLIASLTGLLCNWFYIELDIKVLEIVGDATYGALVLVAALAGFANWCIGCKIFAALMRIGCIPESVCEECARTYVNNVVTKRQMIAAAKISV